MITITLAIRSVHYESFFISKKKKHLYNQFNLVQYVSLFFDYLESQLRCLISRSFSLVEACERQYGMKQILDDCMFGNSSWCILAAHEVFIWSIGVIFYLYSWIMNSIFIDSFNCSWIPSSQTRNSKINRCTSLFIRHNNRHHHHSGHCTANSVEV